MEKKKSKKRVKARDSFRSEIKFIPRHPKRFSPRVRWPLQVVHVDGPVLGPDKEKPPVVRGVEVEVGDRGRVPGRVDGEERGGAEGEGATAKEETGEVVRGDQALLPGQQQLGQRGQGRRGTGTGRRHGWREGNGEHLVTGD